MMNTADTLDSKDEKPLDHDQTNTGTPDLKTTMKDQKSKYKDLISVRTTTLSEPSIASSPYTKFMKTDHYFMLPLSSLASIFSEIGEPIYYPALFIIEAHYSVSETMVNISVVVYLLAQVFTPALVAGCGDEFWRRPVLIWCFSVYILSSLGPCFEGYSCWERSNRLGSLLLFPLSMLSLAIWRLKRTEQGMLVLYPVWDQ